MASKFRQGIFKPINYAKYEGDPTNIVYRSSWELIVLKWMDVSSTVVKYSSEEIIIPYISNVDGKSHRYFPDMKATFKQKDGSLKTFLIEIKPYTQTIPPKNNKNKRILMEQLATYEVNQNKWEAARKYCKDRGYEFMIITEYEIGLKKR